LSNQDKLLLSFLESHPLVRVIIDSFNRSVIENLPRYIENNPIVFESNGDKYKCQFTDIKLSGDVDSSGVPIWPFMCRRNKKDYLLKQKCTIQLYKNVDEDWILVSSRNNFNMWDQLNMLGCSTCWLSKIPRELFPVIQRKWLDVTPSGEIIPFENRDYSLDKVQDFRSVDEDPALPLGYFISSGIAKAVTIQEGLGMNIPFRVIDVKVQTLEYPNGGEMLCDMRSMSQNYEISHVKVVLMKLIPMKKIPGLIGFAFYISLPSFKLKATNVINMMRLAFYFNYDEKDTLNNCIDLFIQYFNMNTALKKVAKHNETTIEDAILIGNDEQLIKLYASIIGIARYRRVENEDVQETPTDEELLVMKTDFNRNFYPHVPTDNLDSKFNVLIDMCVQSAKFKMGIMPASNKDHYGVKRMNDTGNQVYTLNVSCYNAYIRDSLRRKPPDFKEEDYNSIYRTLKNKFDKITVEIHKNFSKSMWGISIRLCHF
jgi:DNA-directed RNA polymerase beta subunit